MKRLIALLAAGAFLFAGVSHVHAQDAVADAGEEDVEIAVDVAVDVEVRVVEGSVVPPGAIEPMDLNFEFSAAGDEMTVAITVPSKEGMRIEMYDLLVTDELFNFSYIDPRTVPTEIECSLDRMHDDSFHGDCFAPEGSMEMTIGAFEE